MEDVIGYSAGFLDKSEVGCFYTDALWSVMGADISFQNTGGVRAALDDGEITKRKIFEISTFNNGTVIYEMTVGEIKNFLRGSGSGFYYAGVTIGQNGADIEILDKNGNHLPAKTILKVRINNYIPAVYDNYFPAKETGNYLLLLKY